MIKNKIIFFIPFIISIILVLSMRLLLNESIVIIAISFVICLLFSFKRKKEKNNNIIVITLIETGIIIAWGIFGSCNFSNINHYNKFANNYDILPLTSQVGDAKAIDVNHYQKRVLLFKDDVHTLIAKYDEKTYLEQKQIIENKYVFEQNLIEQDYDDLKLEPSFIIDDYNFKVVSFEHYDLEYPKEILFVGTSDNKCEIAYVFFYSFDLDYIGQPLNEFLIEDCKWKK